LVPFCEKATASAAPIPELAPVMMAVLPSRSTMERTFFRDMNQLSLLYEKQKNFVKGIIKKGCGSGIALNIEPIRWPQLYGLRP
jgi:hypothetical protein